MTTRSRSLPLRWVSLASVVLLAAALGCDRRAPTGPGRPFAVMDLVDAAHNDGIAGFYFLPPLAPQPTFTGAFDPTLSPLVRICELVEDGCGTEIVVFGAPVVTVDLQDELYQVNWRTQSYPVQTDHTYRIRVFLGTRELGHADIAMGDNRPTIPIKFRIEQGLPPAPVASFTFECQGLTCSFDASGSTAQPTASYSWTWGDGTDPGSGKTATHVYSAGGTYFVTLTVADGGGSNSATQAVTVVAPPVASFTFLCTDLACAFDASGSTAQPTATYSWTWGDETPDGSGAITTHVYAAAGSFSVVLTVADAGGSSSSTQLVTVTAPPPPPPTGRIAFSFDPGDGNREIYAINQDGSGTANLTNSPDFDEGPAWSPDGTRILFERANQEIWVMNADGSGATNLTNDPSFDGQYAWSPDGSKVAFASNRHGNFEIFVMNADGTGATALTDNPAQETSPAWSPDGAMLAFVCQRGGSDDEICVMNADGSNVLQLTDNSASDQSPKWSRDGRIAFISRRDGNNEIYVMNADGTGQTNLTRNSASDAAFVWSPDGSKIAFVSRRDFNDEIYVMNADGTGLTNLTANAGQDNSPAWSSDGSRLAFVSTRDGNNELYFMRADGTGVTRITDTEGFEFQPTWRP
jgi:Tol biopolymer transport system component